MNPIDAVDLPHGVTSPVKAHVHPYPTRFHGGIWTRPVFGMPWVRSPHFVIRPSHLDGMGAVDPTFRPYQGLGEHWDTAAGVFRRPRYDGGGIFNDVSGLGATPGPTAVGTFVGALALGFGITYFLMKR